MQYNIRLTGVLLQLGRKAARFPRIEEVDRQRGRRFAREDRGQSRFVPG